MHRLKSISYLLGAGFALLYILNPGAGVFEILPDNLPVVGNLDEAAMVGLLLACLRGLKNERARVLAREKPESD